MSVAECWIQTWHPAVSSLSEEGLSLGGARWRTKSPERCCYAKKKKLFPHREVTGKEGVISVRFVLQGRVFDLCRYMRLLQLVFVVIKDWFKFQLQLFCVEFACFSPPPHITKHALYVTLSVKGSPFTLLLKMWVKKGKMFITHGMVVLMPFVVGAPMSNTVQQYFRPNRLPSYL